MKIILTFCMKNTSTLAVVLKQAMDELNEINNFNLWEQLSAHVSILPRIFFFNYSIPHTVAFPILK